jgi:hypothetical protein
MRVVSMVGRVLRKVQRAAISVRMSKPVEGRRRR